MEDKIMRLIHHETGRVAEVPLSKKGKDALRKEVKYLKEGQGRCLYSNDTCTFSIQLLKLINGAGGAYQLRRDIKIGR